MSESVLPAETAEAEYWQHPAFEDVVDLLTLASCDHCTAPLGEIAAHIIHAIERPGTPIARIDWSKS